jgi:hypothetical protein
MGLDLPYPLKNPLEFFTKEGCNMRIIKVGIDIHGVINKDPEFFSNLSHRLKAKGHEVHILTGRELSDELYNRLDGYGIRYDHVFSITSHHKEIGTHISYKDNDPTQPLIAPPVWDRTKAHYAEHVGLCVHIDDSPIYGRYFEGTGTQYIQYTSELREFITTLAEVCN